MWILTKSGARTVLDSTSDWHSAENRRLLDLEFFNRIGRKQPLISVDFARFERPLLGKADIQDSVRKADNLDSE